MFPTVWVTRETRVAVLLISLFFLMGFGLWLKRNSVDKTFLSWTKLDLRQKCGPVPGVLGELPNTSKVIHDFGFYLVIQGVSVEWIL